MWANPGRLRRAQTAMGLVNVYAIGSSIIVFATGDIRLMVLVVAALVAYYVVARFEFRCERCGKSPVFWSARHNKASEWMNVTQRPDCPYCGFNVTFPDPQG